MNGMELKELTGNAPVARITFAEDLKTPCHTFILDDMNELIDTAAAYIFLSGTVIHGLYESPLEDFLGRSSSINDPQYEEDGSFYGPLCVEFYLGKDEWYGKYHGTYSLRLVKQNGEWQCLRAEDPNMKGLDDKIWKKADEIMTEFVEMVNAA